MLAHLYAEIKLEAQDVRRSSWRPTNSARIITMSFLRSAVLASDEEHSCEERQYRESLHPAARRQKRHGIGTAFRVFSGDALSSPTSRIARLTTRRPRSQPVAARKDKSSLMTRPCRPRPRSGLAPPASSGRQRSRFLPRACLPHHRRPTL